jgi:hypothetical protein
VKKRDGYVDARPWLVIRASDGRAEVEYDRGFAGLDILPEGRHWREQDARDHRDAYNRKRGAAEAERAKSQGELDLFAGQGS